MGITVKIQESPIIKKKFINDLKKFSKMENIDNTYIFTNISNEEFFVHRIAYEMVEYLYNTDLKNLLSKHFDATKVKEILKNHEEKSYEKNHLAFLLKIKLDLYLKNNEVVNFNSFIKFNAPKIKDEIENIAELEIDADGEFLEDEEEFDGSRKYIECIEVIRALEMNESKKPSIADIHVFKTDKGEYKLVDEYNKNIKINIEPTIKTLTEELYMEEKKSNSFEYAELKFIIAVGYLKPERIILYSSLEEKEDEFIKDFAFFKQGMNLDTECYKSSEPRPSV